MERNYKKFLNKKDPIDKEILKRAKEKKPKVGVRELGKFIK